MALQFFDCITAKFIRSVYNTVSSKTTNAVSSVTIFSGAQPTAAQISASWSTYSAQYLVHWSVAWYSPPLVATLAASQYHYCQLPAAKIAFRSGTAAWGIIWCNSNLSEATIQGGTMPSPARGYIVVPVSDNGGDGCIKVTSTTITAGSSYQPSDITLRFGRS